MKVGFVVPGYGKDISGGWKVIYDYANYLSDHGHEVIIFNLLDTFIEKYPKYIPVVLRMIFYNLATKKHPKWYRLNDDIKKKAIYDKKLITNLDVLVVTSIRTAITVSSLEMDRNKIAYLIQDYENWNYSDDEVNSSYSFGMNNIVVSNWLKQIVDQYSKAPSIYIPDGIDGNCFCVRSDIERTNHSISFHYRDEVIKGCDIAFAVIKRLHDMYKDLIVHVVSRGPCEAELPDYCVFHQKINAEEVAEIDNSISVFLCTSRKEGYGLPGLEAMACGAVLVSTNYLGVREYAIDYDADPENGNSLLSQIDDIEGLVERISRVFDDQELRTHLMSEGLKTASNLTVEKSAMKFESELQRLVWNA